MGSGKESSGKDKIKSTEKKLKKKPQETSNEIKKNKGDKKDKKGKKHSKDNANSHGNLREECSSPAVKKIKREKRGETRDNAFVQLGAEISKKEKTGKSKRKKSKSCSSAKIVAKIKGLVETLERTKKKGKKQDKEAKDGKKKGKSGKKKKEKKGENEADSSDARKKTKEGKDRKPSKKDKLMKKLKLLGINLKMKKGKGKKDKAKKHKGKKGEKEKKGTSKTKSQQKPKSTEDPPVWMKIDPDLSQYLSESILAGETKSLFTQPQSFLGKSIIPLPPQNSQFSSISPIIDKPGDRFGLIGNGLNVNSVRVLGDEQEEFDRGNFGNFSGTNSSQNQLLSFETQSTKRKLQYDEVSRDYNQTSNSIQRTRQGSDVVEKK